MQTEWCFPRTAGRPVHTTPVYLVIADISGYTRFLQEHARDIAHAERVVAELLESVIDVVQVPLVVHELSGDAVSFYALADDDPSMPAHILTQVRAFFQAFNNKMQEIVSCPVVIGCPSCVKTRELRLKVVVHYGEVVLTEVGGFRKVAGPAMILAHRLLKNSIEEDEYLLVTADFYDRCEEMLWERALWKSEYCDSFGDVLVLVQFPVGGASRLAFDSYALDGSPATRRRRRKRHRHGEQLVSWA